MADRQMQDVIDAYAKKHDTDIVIYLGEVTRPEDEYLIKQCKRRRKRKNILLILTTYGGDANAAYRISRCFQEAYQTVTEETATPGPRGKQPKAKVGDFTIFVDSVCKSAGTIICLGADRLILTGNAELGPIDVQLRKQDEIGERHSGLTPLQAVQFLETQSVSMFGRHFHELRFSGALGFSTRMAAEVATNMTTGLLRPVYEQIDPIRLAEMDRSLKIAQEYGERLKGNNLRDGTLDKLLGKYPSHGFVIDKKEARALFKVVESSTAELDEIMEFFRPIVGLSLDKGAPFVYFISSEPPPSPAAAPLAAPAPGPQQAPEKGSEADA